MTKEQKAEVAIIVIVDENNGIGKMAIYFAIFPTI